MARPGSRRSATGPWADMRGTILLAVVAVVVGVGVGAFAHAEPAAPQRVPLVALMVQPDRYDGVEIEVTAWGVVEYEMATLFLDESDYHYLVFENGVWLDFAKRSDSPSEARGYLSVVGSFHSGDEARGFAGRITDIKRVTEQQYQHSPD